MSFRVGQRVVCVSTEDIHDSRVRRDCPPIASEISVGSVYVIRKISNKRHALVWLQGINRRSGDWADSGYFAFRFRPVKETDISIFTAMLAPSPKRKQKTDA